MSLPNLIIAGPPKSGTTSLFEWLSNHPETCPSKLKETNYFNENVPQTGPHFTKNGWDGYNEFFKDGSVGKIVFEASPKYIYSGLAIRELQNIPNLKIIFLRRRESDRLYSEFTFHKYKTKLFEGSFSDYLIHKGIDINKGIQEQNTFGYWLSRWMENFHASQLILIDFKQLKEDPKGTMKKLCKRLELDTEFYSDHDFNIVNKTFGIRSKKLHYFLLKFHRWTPRGLRNVITKIYYSFNKTPIPDPSYEDRDLKKLLESLLREKEREYQKELSKLTL